MHECPHARLSINSGVSPSSDNPSGSKLTRLRCTTMTAQSTIHQNHFLEKSAQGFESGCPSHKRAGTLHIAVSSCDSAVNRVESLRNDSFFNKKTRQMGNVGETVKICHSNQSKYNQITFTTNAFEASVMRAMCQHFPDDRVSIPQISRVSFSWLHCCCTIHIQCDSTTTAISTHSFHLSHLDSHVPSSFSRLVCSISAISTHLFHLPPFHSHVLSQPS
jgi:hypothetical protein